MCFCKCGRLYTLSQNTRYSCNLQIPVLPTLATTGIFWMCWPLGDTETCTEFNSTETFKGRTILTLSFHMFPFLTLVQTGAALPPWQ